MNACRQLHGVHGENSEILYSFMISFPFLPAGKYMLASETTGRVGPPPLSQVVNDNFEYEARSEFKVDSNS